MIRKLKYAFWCWVHDTLEKAWHWTFKHGVSPNKPVDHLAYYVIVGKTTKTVWREDPDGLLTLVKLNGVPYPPKK